MKTIDTETTIEKLTNAYVNAIVYLSECTLNKCADAAEGKSICQYTKCLDEAVKHLHAQKKLYVQKCKKGAGSSSDCQVAKALKAVPKSGQDYAKLKNEVNGMMPQHIYYDGLGAKKSGKHTPKEFIRVMDRHFKDQCSSSHIYDASCSKMMKMQLDFTDARFKNPKYKLSAGLQAKYGEVSAKCMEVRKTTKPRKCDVKAYVEYSGAVDSRT